MPAAVVRYAGEGATVLVEAARFSDALLQKEGLRSRLPRRPLLVNASSYEGALLCPRSRFELFQQLAQLAQPFDHVADGDSLRLPDRCTSSVAASRGSRFGFGGFGLAALMLSPMRRAFGSRLMTFTFTC